MFIKLLEKIDFDYQNDKMIVLGDFIDCNSGSVKIINHFARNKASFEIILGNHEINFLNRTEFYDKYLSNKKVKEGVCILSENFYTSAFLEIRDIVIEYVKNNKIDVIDEDENIKDWLLTKRGYLNGKRNKLLKSIKEFVRIINSDEEIYTEIINTFIYIFSDNNQYKEKYFFKEIVKLPFDKYVKICNFISSNKRNNSSNEYLDYDNIMLKYKDKDFILAHQISKTSPIGGVFGLNFNSLMPNVLLPHIRSFNLKNHYIIYGHKPVAAIHREFSLYETFDFNYKEFFSYLDRNNNRYYNLDVTGSGLGVLCLDDFEEYYIKKEVKKRISKYRFPEEKATYRKKGIVTSDIDFNSPKIIDGKERQRTIKQEDKFISYKDHCMEYAVCISRYMKEIFYKRIDYMPIATYTIIKEERVKELTKEEIVKIIREHDMKRSDDKEIKYIERFLRNPREKYKHSS